MMEPIVPLNELEIKFYEIDINMAGKKFQLLRTLLTNQGDDLLLFLH